MENVCECRIGRGAHLRSIRIVDIVILPVQQIQKLDNNTPLFMNLITELRIEQNRRAGLISSVGGQIAWTKGTQAQTPRKTFVIVQRDPR